MKEWISAFRLRTLPLALSSILMGSFLVARVEAFDWRICLLTILTTIFLQILSNLANDYGDSIHGADSAQRQGPSRSVQDGVISKTSMMYAIKLFAGLSLATGTVLLLLAFDNYMVLLIFLALGLLAIYCAIAYTATKKPYGYMGLGDLSVFVFFGWVGVLGTYFLQIQEIDIKILLPATSCGLFAVGVLNINNIRDIESDESAGKRSIPVRIGRDRAVIYHALLILLGWFSGIAYVALDYVSTWQLMFLVALPLFIKNIIAVSKKTSALDLDPYLKQLALSTLLFVVLFGIGNFFK